MKKVTRNYKIILIIVRDYPLTFAYLILAVSCQHSMIALGHALVLLRYFKSE